MDLEAVGDLALNVILTKLGPKDSARAACISKKLRSLASEESLWLKFCSQDLDLKQPFDPLGNPVPSFKVNPPHRSFIWSFIFSLFSSFLVLYSPIQFISKTKKGKGRERWVAFGNANCQFYFHVMVKGLLKIEFFCPILPAVRDVKFFWGNRERKRSRGVLYLKDINSPLIIRRLFEGWEKHDS